MHFSKVWIRKNFIPNILEDKYGREDIGVEVALNEGESMDEAVLQAQQFIKEHIEKNTVYHSPNISEAYRLADGLPPEPTVLPSIQKDSMEEKVVDVWVKDIEKCETLDQLKTWVVLATQYPKIRQALEIRSIIIKADLLLPPKK